MKVAIIGSGFSGTLTAVHLLRNFPETLKRTSPESLTIDLYEKGSANAQGVAYSTESDVHYLNVPAGKISAFPDDPGHFQRWLEEVGLKTDPAAFVLRKVYARYLGQILMDAERRAEPLAVLSRKFQEVTELSIDGCTGEIAGSFYDAIVLATGNFSPQDVPVRSGMEFYSTARSIRNPWQGDALTKIEKDQPVLLIGTGLTMVDVALDLHAKGHKGVIHALSRHGYLPQAHVLNAPPLAPLSKQTDISIPKTWENGEVRVREIFAWLRSLGEQWRAGMESLRPQTQQLWKRLSTHERARFFRHCRILWDIHRHRLAPQVNAAVMKMIAEEKLKPLAGRLTRFDLSDRSSVQVSYLPRHPKSAEQTLTVGYVINCTGPCNNYSKTDSRLIRDLMRKHLISPHPTYLGLQVTDDGALIDEAGHISTIFYTLGPARQGVLWETIAVPELRVQAQELALLLLKKKKSDTG